MKTVRDVFFFASDMDGDEERKIWVDAPNKAPVLINVDDCMFESNGKKEIIRIVDRRNGVTYIPSPACRLIQW